MIREAICSLRPYPEAKRSNAVSPFWELCYAERFRRLGREEDEEGEGENVGYTYVLKFYLHESL